MSEAFVRCTERCRVVGAEQNTATIGSEHYASGITRIDHHIVDDDVRRCHSVPGRAGVLRLPQAFGGAGKDHFRMLRILFQHARAARGERDSLGLVEEIAAVGALVDAGASAQIHS